MKVAVFSLATCLVAGSAIAQQPSQTTPVSPPPNATVTPNTTTTTTQPHNPAVATTSNANDTAAPAKGSNSFTEGQAKDRIAERGFTNVSDLKKDDDGIWRGMAHDSGGKPVHVWFDYKGNVGETP